MTTLFKRDVFIDNWCIVNKPDDLDTKYLSGLVYGHPRFGNGSYIVSTKILKVDGRIVYTKNTKYYLGDPDKEFLKTVNINDSDEPLEDLWKKK